MKRTETNFIDIGKERLPFRYSILSFIKFQDEFNKEVTEIKTVSDSIAYFYCAYSAGCTFEKIVQKYDYEEFINLIDSYPELMSILSEKLLESSGAKKK